MGPAVEDTRELLVKCVRSHSHTNRTLDSLNNVDRPRYYTPPPCYVPGGMGNRAFQPFGRF